MESTLKFFNPKKASFGRHVTFALRYAWLTKGFQAFNKNQAIFSSDESTIELGVGKNRVNAIKYWLRATTILKDASDGLITTSLGNAIFSKGGWDPYLEDEATISTIHWLLATNSELATAWHWFFNCFHKSEFTNEEASGINGVSVVDSDPIDFRIHRGCLVFKINDTDPINFLPQCLTIQQ
jgi:Protein of unknown function (DUF4007)